MIAPFWVAITLFLPWKEVITAWTVGKDGIEPIFSYYNGWQTTVGSTPLWVSLVIVSLLAILVLLKRPVRQTKAFIAVIANSLALTIMLASRCSEYGMYLGTAMLVATQLCWTMELKRSTKLVERRKIG